MFALIVVVIVMIMSLNLIVNAIIHVNMDFIMIKKILTKKNVNVG